MTSPLEQLFREPLMNVLASRRSRRVARGTSVDAGALSHAATDQPLPLTELEEAVLIVSTGITGVVAHDGPLDTPSGGRELATPFLNVVARAAPSPDNSQPTCFVMINDQGNWLLRRPPADESRRLLRELPPRFAAWAESDWIAVAAAVKHQLSPVRLELPREFPYYIGWNKQLSNVPGTTMFLPLVDTTRMMINGILNLLAEPPGQRPLFVDDFQPFHPHGLRDDVGWVADHLHLVEHIPYQPIGGLSRATGKFVNPKIPMPIGLIRTFLSDHESFFLTHNLMLVAEAMGLAGWVHACAPSAYLLGGDRRTSGLGFRMQTPRKPWRGRWPPPPATLPNPIGLDQVFETLTPPYVSSMDEAVDRVLDQKLGAAGAYHGGEPFALPYRNPRDANTYLETGDRYPPEAVVYAKEICNYLWDTYGRFPAHVDAVYHPGTWLQVGHLELPYYERFFQPWQFAGQSAHAGTWGHG